MFVSILDNIFENLTLFLKFQNWTFFGHFFFGNEKNADIFKKLIRGYYITIILYGLIIFVM